MNSIRAKAIAKSYIKNKFNGAEAGMEIYNTKKRAHAKSMMNKALKLPQVQNAIQEELAEAGITKEYLNKTFKEAIDTNKKGKPSQAVLAQLLMQGMKIYNYIPESKQTTDKQERKIILGKNFEVIRQELTQSTTNSQELLADIQG